jgi:hypothetical protein
MPEGAASTPTSATGNQVTPTEIIHVDTRTVACDGGDARWVTQVFYGFGEQVMCRIARVFVLNPGGSRRGH